MEVLIFVGILVYGLVLLSTESIEDVKKDFGVKSVSYTHLTLPTKA